VIPDLDVMLKAAHEAVSLAARITRAVQRDPQRGHRLTKSDDSPVTIADFAAQAVIADRLSARLGRVTLVAEESARYLRDPAHAAALAACVEATAPVWPGVRAEDLLGAIDVGTTSIPLDASGEPTRSFWTLDPIDGTKGFIRGHQYSLCLAYVHEGVPVVAALACPNLSADVQRPYEDPDPVGLTFLAHAQGPVWVTACDDRHGRLDVLERAHTPAGGPIRLVGSYTAAHNNESTVNRLVRRLEETGVRVQRPQRLDSQVKYAVVARGQADVFLRTPRSAAYRENIWDHAAGSLIARRAGCLATDVLGKDLDFSRGVTLEDNQGIVCGPAGPHGVILGGLAALTTV
jgi:3'(2'), 5'-bisphosphate nucleotidase